MTRLGQQLLGAGGIVAQRRSGPVVPAGDGHIARIPERRERHRPPRLLAHHVVDDLLPVDGERQRLAHAHVVERRRLGLRPVQAPELIDGLHRARDADDLHPAGARLLDRLRTDAPDRRLAGPHHRETGALLGHEQQRQALELWRAPVRVGDGLVLDAVSGDAPDELPGAAADRLVAEALGAHRLDVLLRHDRAFHEDRPGEARRELRDDSPGVNAHGEIVDDLDPVDRPLERRGARGDGLRGHDPLEAELHVVRGEGVAVVEALALAEVEGPALAVGRELPALGDAGPDPALLEVEADQRVPHGRVIVGVRGARVHDRVHDLRAQRVQDDDQRVLVGGRGGGSSHGNQKTAQRQAQQAPDAHACSPWQDGPETTVEPVPHSSQRDAPVSSGSPARARGHGPPHLAFLRPPIRRATLRPSRPKFRDDEVDECHS